MDREVTLKDIAQKMQVSIVTVSNALAGRSGVGDQLRLEIEKTAQQMGYRRKVRREKSAVSKSRLYRIGTRIGVVVPEKYLEKYTSFYWELYQHVVEEASRQGCFVMLEALTGEKEERGEMPLHTRDEELDGLIVLGILSRGYLQKLYQSVACPVVLLDFDDDEIPCDAVISNGFYGMYQMTNYLISLGHTRIGFIGDYRATGSIMDRYQGFCKALLEHGIKENREWVLPDRDLRTGKMELRLPADLPTAFVCNCDLTAQLAAEMLAQAGWRVPEDVSLVGYDDFLVKGSMQGKLTTYAVDMAAMAHQGMKLLLRRMNREQDEKIVRAVNGKMVVRQSTRSLLL